MSKRTNPGPQTVSKSKQIKLVLLGESGVGKSSIALRYVRGEFNEHGEATIGAAFLTKTITVNNCAIKFDIWDTAGQERYHSLAPMYYRGAPAAVVVYDVTNMSSFNRANLWVKELMQQTSQMVIVLAGNKADMANESRAVTKENPSFYLFLFCHQVEKVNDLKNGLSRTITKCIPNLSISGFIGDVHLVSQGMEGKELADEHGLIFAETSAKSGMNVEDIFYSVALKLSSDANSSTPGPGGKNVKLKKDGAKEEKGGCC